MRPVPPSARRGSRHTCQKTGERRWRRTRRWILKVMAVLFVSLMGAKLSVIAFTAITAILIVKLLGVRDEVYDS